MDGPANVAFHDANREAFLEDKLFIEAQQEAVAQAPERKLILREHDKAVAYSRQAIHQLQNTSSVAEYGCDAGCGVIRRITYVQAPLEMAQKRLQNRVPRIGRSGIWAIS